MKMVQLQGLTGLIQFNTSGYRTEVQMDVVQLNSQVWDKLPCIHALKLFITKFSSHFCFQGLRKIGVWDSKFVTKFNWTKAEHHDETKEDDSMDLKNRTLIVTTIMVC